MARILFVEANGAARAATSVLLRSLGHDVIDAADGSEALRLARRIRVDLVLAERSEWSSLGRRRSISQRISPTISS